MWRDFGDALQASIVTVDSVREVGGAATLFRAGLELGQKFLIRHVLAKNWPNQAQEAEKAQEKCHFTAQPIMDRETKQYYRLLCHALRSVTQTLRQNRTKKTLKFS